MADILDFLEDQLPPALIAGLRGFRKDASALEGLQNRLVQPETLYYGKQVWEQAATALLCGQNLLLCGPKATGKNILAENLAAAFGRPVWNISFHINTDADALIGVDTFRNGEVAFRPGPVVQCARAGGFAILDEINMAKNEALAVLHACLDFRRKIDIPGYEPVDLAAPTRFIATMNHGYAGTRELNEALASRFVVVQMPPISHGDLLLLLSSRFPTLKKGPAGQLAQLFLDLQAKCENGELSTRALDLRGLLSAIALAERGLALGTALEMGIANKSFEPYERTLALDLIRARIPQKWDRSGLFGG